MQRIRLNHMPSPVGIRGCSKGERDVKFTIPNDKFLQRRIEGDRRQRNPVEHDLLSQGPAAISSLMVRKKVQVLEWDIQQSFAYNRHSVGEVMVQQIGGYLQTSSLRGRHRRHAQSLNAIVHIERKASENQIQGL
jgi:hypothetical protein